MITSKQNSIVKLIRSLEDKKNRDKTGLFVAEGVNTVNEALKSDLTVKYVVATEKCIERIDKNAIKRKNAETVIVSEEVFDYISFEVTPQGVTAVIEKKENELASPDGNCLFLDEVNDPANVGAVIRTAAASGYNEIYLASSADCYSPKSVRSSMSGIFKVKVFQGSREELLEVIDIPLCIADMKGQNVFEAEMTDKFCLVIGNEARGVSEAVRKKAKLSVSIPMQNGMESLNAGVSAGILMYILANRQKGE